MRHFPRLTKHPLQSKYLVIVMLSMLLPTLVLASCLYFLVFSLLAEQFVLPEAIHSMLIPVFYRINLILVIALPVIFLVVFFFGLSISHRFAGPIERIERDLDAILSGRDKGLLRVRANDDLAGVIGRINRLIEKR